MIFKIEDEAHAEPQGRFETRQAALGELKRRAAIPWNEAPNRAPCMSWRKCSRRYELVEYDDHGWEHTRTLILTISATGVVWAQNEER